jgi:hypothetical protein
MKSKRAWYPSADPLDYQLEEEQQNEKTIPTREAGATVTAAYPSADPSDYETEDQQYKESLAAKQATAMYPSADPSDYPVQAAAKCAGSGR